MLSSFRFVPKFLCFAAAFLSINSNANSSKFALDNDLWRDDSYFVNSNINENMFNEIIDIATAIYQNIATANNEHLSIEKNWNDSTVNADCNRNAGIFTINMYGGLARRSEITLDAFVLVLCHELGHAYGGIPYSMPAILISAEGQADYSATQSCLKKIFPAIKYENNEQTSDYIAKACNNKYVPLSSENKLCVRELLGSQNVGNLLAKMHRHVSPDFETPDPLVTNKTILTYPETVQCRLDTYHNGALNLARPLCWYRD